MGYIRAEEMVFTMPAPEPMEEGELAFDSYRLISLCSDKQGRCRYLRQSLLDRPDQFLDLMNAR